MWYCDYINIILHDDYLSVLEQLGCLYSKHCTLEAMFVGHNEYT